MYKKLIPTLALTIALTGCVGFQQKAGGILATVQAAAVSARETLLPVVDVMCRQAAEFCAETGDMDCPPLVKCDAVRGQVIDILVGLHFTILNANTAVVIGAEEDAWAAINKALALVAQLRGHLKELGIG